MPWCETCGKRVEEEELSDAVDCPGCGKNLHERPPVPWHFKVLIAGTVIYLAYRAYQGVGWLAHHG